MSTGCTTPATAGAGSQGCKIVMLINGEAVDGSEIELPVVRTQHPFTGTKSVIKKLKANDVVTFELRNNRIPRRSFKIPIRRALVSVQMLRWW